MKNRKQVTVKVDNPETFNINSESYLVGLVEKGYKINVEQKPVTRNYIDIALGKAGRRY